MYFSNNFRSCVYSDKLYDILTYYVTYCKIMCVFREPTTLMKGYLSMERQRTIVSEGNVESVKRELMEKFRNELPVLRARACVSQEVLADKIGISRQTYSSIETGKRDMAWTTFLALVVYFQNNEMTRQMIENFNEDMSVVMRGK